MGTLDCVTCGTILILVFFREHNVFFELWLDPGFQLIRVIGGDGGILRESPG